MTQWSYDLKRAFENVQEAIKRHDKLEVFRNGGLITIRPASISFEEERIFNPWAHNNADKKVIFHILDEFGVNHAIHFFNNEDDSDIKSKLKIFNSSYETKCTCGVASMGEGIHSHFCIFNGQVELKNYNEYVKHFKGKK
jgi:hypothetical protein